MEVSRNPFDKREAALAGWFSKACKATLHRRLLWFEGRGNIFPKTRRFIEYDIRLSTSDNAGRLRQFFNEKDVEKDENKDA